MSVIRNKPNRQTWDRVLAGDVTAYQAVVESHQSAVSAVAYAIIGDFPISQDIAQETFWVAWTKRNSLRDVKKLGSWLCGIARNLAKQWRKKQKRVAKSSGGDLAYEPAAEGLDPAQQSIADEEQQVVWSALEQIPENFREVLTLYYRQGQSIAEVAESLDITADSARQRLSRGRNLLRGRVSKLIEGVLIRTTPDKSFAAKVIAGLAGVGLAAKTGTAAAGTIGANVAAAGTVAGVAAVKGVAGAKGVLAAGVSVGMIGGLLGAIGGLAGGYIGTWLPAQLAPTETERQYLLQQGRIILGKAIVFFVSIIALSLAYAFFQFNGWYYFAAFSALMIAFMFPLIVHSIRLSRQVQELRRNLSADDDPNQSQLAAYGKKIGLHSHHKGRSYTSDFTLFGYPLIDIQFSDADFGGRPIDKAKRKRARGWIALGDTATGILFAAGGVARGFIAFGGLAIGAISFGGLSIGVVSLGGMSIGLVWAFGGAAIGYDAAGGGAIGWHSAAGGGAVAWQIAFGGFAAAWEYAVGGAAYAKDANTMMAERMVETHSFKGLIEWLAKNQTVFIVGTIVVSLIPVFLLKLIYITEEEEELIE